MEDVQQKLVVEFPEELKKKAREFFTVGAETAYTLNYGYAIEMYLDGLSFWPDAMEDGHQGGRRYQPNDPGYRVLTKWVMNQVTIQRKYGRD